VVCEGTQACDDVTILCPVDHACNVSCDGDEACADATFVCNTGTCDVQCLGGVSPCDSATLECGKNDSELGCHALEADDPPEEDDHPQSACACEVIGCA
jgi:hypothetical protein